MFNPAEPRVAAGSATAGQWTAGGSGSSSQQQQSGKKKPAKKPKSKDELRAEAHRDLEKAKELQKRAVALRHQIHQMQQKLSNLYRLHSGGSSKKPSGSKKPAAGGAAAASSSGAAAKKPSASSASSKKPSSTSTASQIASAKAGISSLQHQLSGIESQIKNLKAQAASLSAQAAKKSVEEPAIMTADLIEKAATLTGAGELTYLSFPIEKTETTADGDLVVYGKATDGSVDSDEQIVDPDFSAKAIKEWLESGGNVRVQHNPQRDPAGVGMTADPGPDGSQWVKSLVVEPVAKRLVSKGALRAYSVGIAKPIIVRDAVARGGRITGGQIVEISLVDRPANKNCGIQLVKAAGSDGHPEYVGKVFGADDIVAKAAGMTVEEVTGSVILELPDDVQVSFSPNDLDKILKHRRATAEKRQLEDGRVVDSGGRDVSDLADDDFAGPDKTYPIKTRDDVSDAASLAHHADNPGAVRARIRSIAQRKFGMTGDDMPPSLKAEGEPTKIIVEGTGDKDHDGDGLFDADGDGDGAVAKLPSSADKGKKCSLCKGSGKIREGHMDCPDCKGSGMASGSADDSAEKGDGPDCPLCKGSGKIRAGHVTCPKCKGSGKMSADAQADAAKAAEKAQRKAEKDAIREALLDGIIKTSGPDASESAEAADDDEDDKDDDDAGPKHSGDGMDEGLDVSKGMKCSGKNCDDPDHDHDHGMSGEDEDEDDDGEEATKAGKILPGGPKKKGKKKAKEMPPVASMKPEGRPKASGPAVDPSGKPSSMQSKGSKPTVGHGTQPVPGHREPDGPAVESFEHDAGLPTEPDEMKTAKWQRAIGVSASWGALHDLTCAAYAPGVAEKSHPGMRISDLIDTSEWQRIAMDRAATAPIGEALKAQQLWESAVTIKSSDKVLIDDIKDEANKAFSDANPGPGRGLTPTQCSPGMFKRPYIATGHAAPSPGHQGPNTAPVPSGQISASQYRRPFIQDGHANDSPANGPAMTPVGSKQAADATTAVPTATGKPSNAARRYYTNAQRDNAKQAMQAMHDHIAETFPDLCPMGQHTAAPNSVPAVKADTEVEPVMPKVKKVKNADLDSLVRRLEKLVFKGEMSLEDARNELLKTQEPAADDPGEMVTKAAVAGAGAISPDVLKAAITQAVEDATSELTTELKRLRKRVSSLENGADPNVQAWKGVAMTPPAPPQAPAYMQASAVPAGMPTMTEVAERTQLMMMRELEDQFRNSPDSAQREAAWTAICKMRGLL